MNNTKNYSDLGRKNVKIPVDLHERLVKVADKHGYRIEALVAQGVEKRVKELEAKK